MEILNNINSIDDIGEAKTKLSKLNKTVVNPARIYYLKL